LSTTNGGVAQQYHWDSAGRGVEYTLTDGSWSLIQTYFDGSTLGLRVNSGAWQTTSATTLGSTTGLVYLGSNYNGSKYLNGLLADVALSKTVFTSQQFDDIKARLNSDYALSL
jgi:YD repeat-containing protein